MRVFVPFLGSNCSSHLKNHAHGRVLELLSRKRGFLLHPFLVASRHYPWSPSTSTSLPLRTARERSLDMSVEFVTLRRALFDAFDSLTNEAIARGPSHDCRLACNYLSFLPD